MTELMDLAAIVIGLCAGVGVAACILILALCALEDFADREIERAFREAGVERCASCHAKHDRVRLPDGRFAPRGGDANVR